MYGVAGEPCSERLVGHIGFTQLPQLRFCGNSFTLCKEPNSTYCSAVIYLPSIVNPHWSCIPPWTLTIIGVPAFTDSQVPNPNPSLDAILIVTSDKLYR